MNFIDTIAADDTVLFIGSGVSQWSGLPSWKGLLTALAAYMDSHGLDSALVRSEIGNGDLLQAASYGFDKLTKSQIGEFIQLAFRTGKAEPSLLHQAIVNLGPRCYITTNYDNLIEESLRRWRPDLTFQQPITNRHLLETAGIVQARSSNFIFKPHGDAADVESIVLTREQYRALLPGGERQAALESLKTLMISRPIVFVGFGLRDPDFLYVRDLLSNIYKGGVRDHYALMADVSASEVDYWRRSYGVHLISYSTREGAEGRDHSELRELLLSAKKTVVEKAMSVGAKPRCAPIDSETTLALARYAARLTRMPKQSPEFPVRITRHRDNLVEKQFGRMHEFDNARVERFLDSYDKSAVLVGLPGSGKSYALRQAAARLSELLHSSCLSENLNAADLVIPLFADLKLYEGSLYDLLDSSLPKDIELAWLQSNFKLRIFLDSFNEMPRRYIEEGQYEGDFRKLVNDCKLGAVVIGSRTSDGLLDLKFDVYELAAIDEAAVKAELERKSIALEGRFQDEMLVLLQRPFFFRYVLLGEIELPPEPHPREFYARLINRVDRRLSERFCIEIDSAGFLRAAAYSALNSGQEAFLLDTLLRAINANIPREVRCRLEPRDIANWLVSDSVLTPYSGGRVAFVHQSITEYLAAAELAARFSVSPTVLCEKLALRRWDQALFLALSQLTPAVAKAFFDKVLEIDLVLGLAAAKFLETGRDEVVSDLLAAVIEKRSTLDAYDYRLTNALTGLPIAACHEPLLRQLFDTGHPLGNSAIELLITLRGAQIKEEMLALMAKHHSDYNLCANSIAVGLSVHSELQDISAIVRLCGELESSIAETPTEEGLAGFTQGAATFLEELPLASVAAALEPTSVEDVAKHPIRAQVFCRLLSHHHTTAALVSALRLVSFGYLGACFVVYLLLRFKKADSHVDVSVISKEHVEQLISIYSAGPENENDWRWALDALEQICSVREDVRNLVHGRAQSLSGLRRVGLLKAANPGDSQLIFDVLGSFLMAAPEALLGENFACIEHWEIDWSGRADLFMRLINLRNSKLTSALLGPCVPADLTGLGQVHIDDIGSWLKWLTNLQDEGKDSSWLFSKLARFLADYADEDTGRCLLDEFNESASQYRSLLLRHILPYLTGVSTDDLSEESTRFVLRDLIDGPEIDPHESSFVIMAATESFATERLMPLLKAEGKVSERICVILKDVGIRHGRRYFV